MFGGIAKWVAQIETPSACPEYLYRAFTTATSGRPGPGRARAAGGHARRGGRRRRRTARTRRCRRTRARTSWRACASCSPAPSGRSRSSAGAAGRSRPRRTSPPSPRRTRSPSAPGSAARTTSTTPRRVYAGHVGIGPDPKLAARVRDADLLLVVGARLGESTTGGYTLVAAGRPHQTLVHVHAAPRSSAACTSRSSGSSPAHRSSRPPRAALEPVDSSAWRDRDRAGARRPPREHGAHARARRRADGRRDGGAARAAAGRRDPHERRRQLLRLGAPLLRVPPLPDAARADERRHGLRRARRRRRQAASTPSAWSSASPATATS